MPYVDAGDSLIRGACLAHLIQDAVHLGAVVDRVTDHPNGGAS